MNSSKASTSKRPAYQFYPGDWLHDSALRACTLAARGLWIDMNCLMHQGDPYGHLTLRRMDGNKDTCRPILPPVLARMVGSNEEEVTALLRELEDAGVFSWTDKGVIFCRRMVKDEKLREIRGSGGHKSLQNPNVPRPKDRSKDTYGGSLEVSSEGSPSSSSSSSESREELSEEDLMEVYRLYPRKEARAEAIRAIRKAIGRIAKAERISHAQALDKLKTCVQSYAIQERKRGTEKHYIPMPATWFNQERYEDDSLNANLSSTPAVISEDFGYRSNAVCLSDIRRAGSEAAQ